MLFQVYISIVQATTHFLVIHTFKKNPVTTTQTTMHYTSYQWLESIL